MKANVSMHDHGTAVTFELTATLEVDNYMRPFLIRHSETLATAFLHDVQFAHNERLCQTKEIWVEGRIVAFNCATMAAVTPHVDLTMHMSVARCDSRSATDNVVWLGDAITCSPDGHDPTANEPDTTDDEEDATFTTGCGHRVMFEAMNVETCAAFLHRTGTIHANTFHHNTKVLERCSTGMNSCWETTPAAIVMPDGTVVRDLDAYIRANLKRLRAFLLPDYLVHARLTSHNTEASTQAVIACFCAHPCDALDAITAATRQITWKQWATELLND